MVRLERLVLVNTCVLIHGSRFVTSLTWFIRIWEGEPGWGIRGFFWAGGDCEETGSTIEVGGGWAAKIRRESAAGAIYANKGGYPSVEDVAANFDKICDFSEGAEAIESIQEATMRIMTALMDMPEAPAEPEPVVEDEGL